MGLLVCRLQRLVQVPARLRGASALTDTNKVTRVTLCQRQEEHPHTHPQVSDKIPPQRAERQFADDSPRTPAYMQTINVPTNAGVVLRFLMFLLSPRSLTRATPRLPDSCISLLDQPGRLRHHGVLSDANFIRRRGHESLHEQTLEHFGWVSLPDLQRFPHLLLINP